MQIFRSLYKSFFTLCFITAACLVCHAQMEIIPSRLDFGLTTPQTEWIIDVHIHNKGPKKDFVLRHTFSHEYEVLFTSKALMPDSTVTMRIKFKPREKGKFSENIELYFASMDEPVIFPVSAVVDYKNPNDNIACPDFSRLAADCCPDNMFMVEVVDAFTKQPIERSSIKIREEQLTRMKLETNKDGKVAQTIPIAYYEIAVSHKNYLPKQINTYINHRNAYFRFELERLPESVTAQEEKRDSITVEMPDVVEIAATTVSEIMPEDRFKPNNVVFLLDVSQSMSQGDKLALMKGALTQLARVLRSVDKITLISYADNAMTLLETTAGSERNTVISIVNEISVSGATAAAKGFRASYNVLKREMINDGNNQLIVITDGAFQPDDQEEINKLVRKSSGRMTTSIVGIQCAPFAIRKLSDVVMLGNGSFLLIEDENDLSILIEEMKKRSEK